MLIVFRLQQFIDAEITYVRKYLERKQIFSVPCSSAIVEETHRVKNMTSWILFVMQFH